MKFTVLFLNKYSTVEPLLSGQLGGMQGVSVTKKMPITEKYVYCVYSHVPLKAKGRHLALLEKPGEGKATGCRTM